MTRFYNILQIARTSLVIFPKDDLPSLKKGCQSNPHRCMVIYTHFKYIHKVNEIGKFAHFPENSSFV